LPSEQYTAGRAAYHTTSIARETPEGGDYHKGLEMVKNNLIKIAEQYNWPNIVNQYEEFIVDCYNRSKQ
jgi:hypothetical protein